MNDGRFDVKAFDRKLVIVFALVWLSVVLLCGCPKAAKADSAPRFEVGTAQSLLPSSPFACATVSVRGPGCVKLEIPAGPLVAEKKMDWFVTASYAVGEKTPYLDAGMFGVDAGLRGSNWRGGVGYVTAGNLVIVYARTSLAKW